MGAGADTDLSIIILADGARPDVLRELAAAGELPHMERGLLSGGFEYTGVTVLPSATTVAYLPMLTGHYPGTANVPGLRWLDKAKFRSGPLLLEGHRSYVGMAHGRLDEDLSPDVETIFELNPNSLSVRCDVSRGMSEENGSFTPRLSTPFMFFAHYLGRGDFVDHAVTTSALRWLARADRSQPMFAFIPLVDVDKLSHRCGPSHRRTVDAYRRLDAQVGRIMAWLRDNKLWDRTHFIVTSDHGHTQTRQHLDISALLSELGYHVFEHPFIYRRKADAAVMVSGNAFANVYFPSEGRWEAPLDCGEIEEEHSAALNAIRRREEVEWCAYRNRSGGVKIVSSEGEAILGREGETYTYAFDGADPLRLSSQRGSFPRSEALAQTIETDFPDSLENVWHLFRSRRTGDIVVTSKPGYDLRGWREVPEHHSSHGALCREHMSVPVLSNRPLVADGGIRTTDLFPTVVEGLKLTPTKPHFGRSLL